MDNVQSCEFHHPEFGRLRVYVIDGKIFFNMQDVASCLGYSSIEEMLEDTGGVDSKDVFNMYINPNN